MPSVLGRATVIWSRTTGGFVYSSPAIFDETVYVGSYDGNLYAFDAATGDTRWAFPAGGAISGSPTVMGGLVYFSTLEGMTYAVDASTGEQVWTFDDGEYTPLVTDRATSLHRRSRTAVRIRAGRSGVR